MKVSVYIAASLDGFIARENGALDWLPGSDGKSEGEDYGFSQFMATVDVLVMGRYTYEMVLSFGRWPYGNKPVIVLSSNPLQIPGHLIGKVEHKSCSPLELVRELEGSNVKHIYVDGGKTIQGFFRAGLVQELIITRVPILLGSGVPLFGELDSDQRLHHIDTRVYKNGFVQSTYQVLNMISQ